MRRKAVLVTGALLVALLTAVVGNSPARAQQGGERMAQRVEEMFPPSRKPPVEMKCPPERDFFVSSVITPTFMDKQNLCLRAGRPFYLVAKQQFRVCREPLLQCPRERQVDIYVHQGMWVTVHERKLGLLFVSYDSGGIQSGYADPKLLEAPHSMY